MELTRRRLLTTGAIVAGLGGLAGCIDGSSGQSTGANATTAQASFFVFGDVASRVAGDAADAELLVPVGQHGHGWEPGPRVREDIHAADLFVHGMDGFQPWVDDIKRDLEADGSDVEPIDASAGISLIEAGHSDHEEDPDHGDDGHSHEDDPDSEHEQEDDGDDHSGRADPHFWMDPLRVKEAVETVRGGLSEIDSETADAYAENAESFGDRLDDLHEKIEGTIADGSNDVILIAGHDSFGYFADRYGVQIEALTSVSRTIFRPLGT